MLAAHISNILSSEKADNLSAEDFFPHWAEESFEERKNRKEASKKRGVNLIKDMAEKGRALQKLKELK